jgi:hypothetical protein
MSDREDVSQYPVDMSNDADESYLGDATNIDDNVAQDPADAEYATAEEMVHYIDPATFNDYLRANGEKYRVRTTRMEKRLYARPVLLSQIIDSGPGIIGGFNFIETTGAAPAMVSFHDGIDSNAATILEIPILAGRGERLLFGADNGIHYRYGLYVSIDSGAVRGTFFHVVNTAV